jgi:hypothetical protein
VACAQLLKVPHSQRIRSGQRIHVDGDAGTGRLLDATAEAGTRRSLAELPSKASTTLHARIIVFVAVVAGRLLPLLLPPREVVGLAAGGADPSTHSFALHWCDWVVRGHAFFLPGRVLHSDDVVGLKASCRGAHLHAML